MAVPNGHGYRALAKAWSSGNLITKDSSGNIIYTEDAANRKVTFPSGSTLDLSAATFIQPSTTQQTGFREIPLASWRLVATNDVPAIAVASGNGGNLASDTAPKLIRVNTSTDKALRIQWASSSGVEILADFVYPPDLDNSQNVIFHMLAAMGGATDTPTAAVGYWKGVGGSNVGGNTAAITGTTVTEYTVTITSTNVGAYPNKASLQITPGTHTTDALNLYATWLTWTKKTS